MPRLSIPAVVLIALMVPRLHAGTSNSLLDVSPDGARLLVANTDNGTVTVIDTAKREVIREIKVGAKPESVAWIGSGPRAVATLYAESAVVFFDAASGAI